MRCSSGASAGGGEGAPDVCRGGGGSPSSAPGADSGRIGGQGGGEQLHHQAAENADPVGLDRSEERQLEHSGRAAAAAGLDSLAIGAVAEQEQRGDLRKAAGLPTNRPYEDEGIRGTGEGRHLDARAVPHGAQERRPGVNPMAGVEELTRVDKRKQMAANGVGGWLGAATPIRK